MLTILQPRALRDAQLTLIASVKAVTSGRRIPAYVKTLNAIQRNQIPLPEGEQTPILDFALDSPMVQAFLTELSGEPEIERFSPDEQREITQKVDAGFQRLNAFDPRAADAVRHLIARLVFAKHPLRAGGSAANTVGMVWLNPPASAQADDYAEFLWHEATHQALFLADMLDPLFTLERRFGAMPQITSAIRRQPRDYDLAFHAAGVAASLIELHESLGNHAPAAELRRGMSLTMSELMALTEPLTVAGRTILLELDALERAPGLQQVRALEESAAGGAAAARWA